MPRGGDSGDGRTKPIWRWGWCGLGLGLVKAAGSGTAEVWRGQKVRSESKGRRSVRAACILGRDESTDDEQTRHRTAPHSRDQLQSQSLGILQRDVRLDDVAAGLGDITVSFEDWHSHRLLHPYAGISVV